MPYLSTSALNREIRAQRAGWIARDTEIARLPEHLRRLRLGDEGDDPAEEDEGRRAAEVEAPTFLAAAALPRIVDWRNRNGNHVTPPKDQGNCGSCVSFCVAGLVESMASIEHGQLLNLSEADLHFCSSHGADCGGWKAKKALGQVRERGIPDEAAFPYPTGLPASAACQLAPDRHLRAVRIKDFGPVYGSVFPDSASYDLRARKQILANHGPVSASMTVYTDFYSYGSGVYRHVSGDSEGGHCVLVIGYSDADRCWICKNSWGSGWGESGYFRIAYGECGIDLPYKPFHWASGVVLAGTHWSGWESLGGRLTSRPQAVCWNSRRIDVVVRGSDSAVHHKWWNGSSWHGWESLGNFIHGAPAISSRGDRRLDIFAVGWDHQLHHRWFDGGGWSDWERLGGFLTSEPAVVSWDSDRIDVFARGGDNAMWHLWWDGDWHGWENLGGQLSSAPAVSSWTPGRLDTFVRGTDCALWHKYFDGGWSEWESLGGLITEAPGAVSWGAGRIDVFAPGTDFHMWHKAWDGSQWLDWENLGGTLCSGVGACSRGLGRLDAFVMGTDSQMYHKWITG